MTSSGSVATAKAAKNINWFQTILMRWFSETGRNFPWRCPSSTRYQVILSEVLLQRTRAEVVASFFPRFIRRWPSWRALAIASEKELQDYLKPIGLWKRRASSMIRLAKELSLRKGKYPRNRQEIEALPGVGQYIANAILMFCHGDSQPLLDTNMARVLERFFGPRKLADIRYDPYLQDLALRAVKGNNPTSMNWALLDLAALICKQAVPLCLRCPLAARCRFATRGIQKKGGLHLFPTGNSRRIGKALNRERANHSD